MATRDRLLQEAGLRRGDVVLDIGTGDGFVGFEALTFVGETGTVMFSDVSTTLLEYCRVKARERSALDRSRFVEASAEDLHGVDDSSVDVVTVRSVLMYVADKERAFEEFARVLKPGGRLALFEPLLGRPGGTGTRAIWWGDYDLSEVETLAKKVAAAYANASPSDLKPIVDFEPQDLLKHAEQAGFGSVRATIELQVAPVRSREAAWGTFFQVAPHPLVPSLNDAVDQHLCPEEAATFVARIHDQFLRDDAPMRTAVVYLWGTQTSGTDRR